MTMKLDRRFARFVAVTALFVGSHDVHAIGDSGGCSIDTQYHQVLSLGTVAQVESHVALKMSSAEKALDLNQRMALEANPSRRKAWQDDTRAQLLGGQMTCEMSFPLDLAVGHGNLEVVRWLLAQGVDPNARSITGKRNVFTRCSAGGYGGTAGTSKEQAERRLQAYQLLVARGADVNALDPFQRLGGCMNKDMYPLLKQLGARVTSEAFVSQVDAARPGGEAISESAWAAVEQLARWQAFDFRGTVFEERLLTMMDARAKMSDYNAVVDVARRLGSIVRLSPGIVPGQPARPEDIPAKFSATRERCYFPEISAYPDFDFQALWRDDAPGQRGSGAPDITEVKVGKTKAPLLLALFNNRDVPTTWKISRSSDAQILGVMVLRNTIGGRGGKDALSFDPLRPAFLGDTGDCAVLVVPQVKTRDPHNRLKPYWPANPATHTFNPFRLRGEPAISVSQGNQFAVGEIPAAGALTSWPDSRREPMPAAKK